MPTRSPQADNFRRRVNKTSSNYFVTIVPEAFKDGYLHYFKNIIRIYQVRVAKRTYDFSELKNLMHPERYTDLSKEQVKTFSEIGPFLRHLYKGTQYIIYGKGDTRPFELDFDEDELLDLFETIVKSKPEWISYATAVRFNFGNGLIRSLPLPSIQVNTRLKPIKMSKLPSIRRKKNRRSPTRRSARLAAKKGSR